MKPLIQKRVLVICGDQYHPAEIVAAGLQSAAPAFSFDKATDGPLGSIPTDCSAVVLAKLNVSSPSDGTPWISSESDEGLGRFVERGGGLFVVHAGTVGYNGSPSVRRMTGGSFHYHPEACELAINPVDGHPLTKSVGEFAIRGEQYFLDVDEGQDEFLHTESCHGRQPAGWRKGWGLGRVCVITPGHFASVWAHASFQSLVRNALVWVTGG